MSDQNPALVTALRHMHFLSETIGGRGSCTASEARAAEYLATEMQELGIQNVRLERFKGAPSTYRPYAIAFTAGLLGTLFIWLFQERWVYLLAALLNALGAWGMLAETDFSPNWMRLLLPLGNSQNVVGVIAPKEERLRQVVLSAHIDTHRTPIFYSSKTWHFFFSIFVGGTFASMLISALIYLSGAIFGWTWVNFIGLLAAAIEIFALSMMIHADLTTFSPGANDDASGIGVTLAIAEQLRSQPLLHTQVWLAFTGCEEAASYGILSFLRRHKDYLGKDAVYIINDQVAYGRLSYIKSDGLIRKYKTHPDALALARQAKHELFHLDVIEDNGIANTDATIATKHGCKAISIFTNLPRGSKEGTYWHQMSDTMSNIDARALQDAFTFTGHLLHIIDRTADPSHDRSPLMVTTRS